MREYMRIVPITDLRSSEVSVNFKG